MSNVPKPRAVCPWCKIPTETVETFVAHDSGSVSCQVRCTVCNARGPEVMRLGYDAARAGALAKWNDWSGVCYRVGMDEDGYKGGM